MENFSLRQIKLTDGFFYERQKINAQTTLPAIYTRFSETGRFKAIKCINEPPHSHVYWDSDVAKWLESASYILARKEDEQVRAWYDEAIDDIVKNQCENGYFNSYFQVYKPDEIFTHRHDHELYCAGHLFEAAVASSKYLNDNRLLGVCEKYVDYIYERFVEKKDTAFTTPGHEEIELALLRLYRLTKKEKYKTLAKYFLDNRGLSEEDNIILAQSHIPIREQVSAEGHAVRATYLYTAMADFAQLTNDTQIKQNLEMIFNDIIKRKMYITGGTGSTHCGERYTVAYDLPNYSAYSETCASVGLVFFCDQMLRLTGNKIYGDVLERALYNGVLAGISLSGDNFFYVNPLEMQLERTKDHLDKAKHTVLNRYVYVERCPIPKRVKIFSTSCCPPNICRLIEKIPQYVWYADEKNSTLTLSQYVSSSLSSDFVDATIFSSMPYSGKVQLKINSKGKKITLRIRKPAWSSASFENEKNGYLIYEGVFENTEINVDFSPSLKKVYSNPLVAENSGKVALTYGPIVLCAEGSDNDFNIFGVKIGDISKAKIEPLNSSPYALNVTLPVSYFEDSGELYSYEQGREIIKTLKLIPYFAWANRKENDMRVWFPNKE
ncbi:MAG: glycoside hydrolase family 127 protein [Clostridiales bacterium]|nr:glycoside hydrolase family 127 protein [Clostridiales bacterium]